MMNIEILYEDRDIIVCVKPHGVPSQSDRSSAMDMISWIKNHLAAESGEKGGFYVGAVHRLDRPVAGVMVYAKTKKAAEDLSRQFSAHTTEKYYLALLTGKMAQEQGKLENFLQKDGRTNTSSVVASGGKRACLEYRILGEKDGLSLAEIHLNTGRHHQIRVQTAYAGAGIYGDMKYNSDQTDMWKKEHGVQREKTELCLFAWRLVFEHPSLHKRMIFKVLPKTGRMCIDEWPCLSYYE